MPRASKKSRLADAVQPEPPPSETRLPVTAKQAHRLLIEEDRRRRVAEFAARGERWRQDAIAWKHDWEHGGRERAEREAAERARLRREQFLRDREQYQLDQEKQRKREERARAKAEREAMRSPEEKRADQAERERREKVRAKKRRAEWADRRKAYAEQARLDEEQLRRLREAASAASESLEELLRRLREQAASFGDPSNFGGSFFAPDPTDPFTVLGLTRVATRDQVKARYRELAKQHHPDKGGDVAKFREIQTAYERAVQAVDRKLRS